MARTKTNPPLLTFENVSKSFGPLEILKNVNLSLSTGESIAIVGPSGSGKSTLLHLAGLMDQATAGAIWLEQESITTLTEKRLADLRLNKIGFLFQFHYLLPDFNTLENVLLPARLAGDDLKKAHLTATMLLERVGLKDRLHHRPYELSGGEQQRTALVRALIRKPKLLLCDEPTGNLDQETAKEVSDLIWSETKQNDVAVLVVTHNMTLAQQADACVQLINGNLKEKRR